MAVEVSAGALPRIGLIGFDPLRTLGLQVLLRDGVQYEVQSLNGARAQDLSHLDMVLVDSASSDHPEALIEAFRRLRPQTRLLVVGEVDDEAFVEGMIEAGAQGYLRQGASEAELRSAVKVVRDGSIWAPRRVLVRLLERARRKAVTGKVEKPALTRREAEVLHLLVQGRSNREISRVLGVDEGTVKSHLSRLMRKAGVGNRTALTMRALESDWAGG